MLQVLHGTINTKYGFSKTLLQKHGSTFAKRWNAEPWRTKPLAPSPQSLCHLRQCTIWPHMLYRESRSTDFLLQFLPCCALKHISRTPWQRSSIQTIPVLFIFLFTQPLSSLSHRHNPCICRRQPQNISARWQMETDRHPPHNLVQKDILLQLEKSQRRTHVAVRSCHVKDWVTVSVREQESGHSLLTLIHRESRVMKEQIH